MKKALLCTISLLSISISCSSQTLVDSASNTADTLNLIYTIVDKEANFPGESVAWRKYLQKNLKIRLPVKNGAPDGSYPIIVCFTVTKDGVLTDFYPLTKFGYGMEEEVIRVIKKGPNWEPGSRSRPGDIYYTCQ